MTSLRISLLFTLISAYCNGQIDSADFKHRYQKDVIYLSVPGYLKNDIRYCKRHLKTEFDFSPEGSKIFKLRQDDVTKSFLYASLALAVYFAANKAAQYNTGSSEVLFYSSLVPLGVSFHFAIRSNKRMKRAIWLRNRDVLLN